MAHAASCWPPDSPPADTTRAAARPTTRFFGLSAPSATPATRDFPGEYWAIPSIHPGMEPSSSARGRLRNFRTAATTRYNPSASLSAPDQVAWSEPGAKLTAPAIATNSPSTAPTPAMNPKRKADALTRGLLVNRRSIAGMMLTGEMVTTNARGSISPITTRNVDSLRLRAHRSYWPGEPVERRSTERSGPARSARRRRDRTREERCRKGADLMSGCGGYVGAPQVRGGGSHQIQEVVDVELLPDVLADLPE